MVPEFCSNCQVLAMRKRERLLANVSLMLLASCCLVICTDQSREGQTGGEPDSIQRSGAPYASSAESELRREADVLRIASELCARHPDKCRQDPEFRFGHKPSPGATRRLESRRTPPWPSAHLYDLFRVDEVQQQQQQKLISATNRTGAGWQVDEFGVWREPLQSARAHSGELAAPAATRSNQRPDARFGAKIMQRDARDFQSTSGAGEPAERGSARQRWRQRNMNQHIMAALPSAFAFSELAVGGGGPRSTRQQRSDDDQHQHHQQQVSLHRRWASEGGSGAAAAAAAAGKFSSTTSGHQMIASVGTMSLDEEAAMECSVKQFSFTATKTDEQGNRCSGEVRASICYGGCDTGEIADWLFPGKKSIHKVCRHGRRLRRRALLNDCNNDSIGPEDPLRVYHYVDAHDCVCKKCASVDTTCLGTMSRPYLRSGSGAAAGSSSAADELANGLSSLIDGAGGHD